MLNWLKSRIDSLRGTVVNALALVSEHLAGQLWLIEAKFLPLAKDAYSKNEVVYACVNLLASSVPEPPLVAYQKTRGTEEKQALGYDHPLMALIKSPNELQTEYEFWELTTICMAIIGRAFWWKRRDNAGRIIALWPLRPDRVGPIYSDSDAPGEQVLFGWSYQQPGTGRVVPIPRRDMLAFNFPDPAGESGGIVEGLGPVQALARQIASDNEATRYVGALLANYAIPGVAVKLKQTVQEGQAQAVKAHFRAEFGGANRGIPAILDADAEITEIGFNLKDLEFPELREVSESRISGALGVPAVLAGLRIGLKESNNRASLAELREYFAETTLSNYWRRYSDQFTNDIASEFGPGLVCEFDTGRVKALAGQRQQQIAPIVDGFKAGGVLLNEYRAALHLPPLEGGDIRLVPTNVIEVLGMTQEAVKALPVGQRLMLLPATKHLPGQHDQGAHGSGGASALDVSGIAGNSPAALHRRAEVFNEAFSKSKVAVNKEARAEVLRDGRIEYSENARSGSGRTYRKKISFREALFMLDGNDSLAIMNEIHGGKAFDVFDILGDEEAIALKAVDPRDEAERRLQRGLEELFSKWAPELAERIRKGEVITDQELAAGFQRVIEPQLVLAATNEGVRIAAEVGVQFDPAVVNEQAATWARGYSFELVKGLADTSRKVLQNAISKYADTPGMTRGDLEKLIEPAFGAVRAEAIAITEISRAASEANNTYQSQLAEQGITMERIWRTSNDEIVQQCPICWPKNNKPEAFWKEEFPNGPPGHVRCRCSTTLRTVRAKAEVA